MVVQADNLRRAQSGEHHLTKLVEQAGPMFARNQVNQRWISGESTRWNEFLSESKRWNEFLSESKRWNEFLSESKFQVYKILSNWFISSFHFAFCCWLSRTFRCKVPWRKWNASAPWWWNYGMEDDDLGLVDFLMMNLWIYESQRFLQQKHICSSIISCFFLKNPVTLLDSWKSNTQFFFNGRNTEASEWMRTRPWNGALIEAEAVRFKNLWTCDILTRQGLWENVRSKHGNEMRRKWRQHLDLMEQNSKILEVFFSVSHRFWLMLKEFVEDDAFYIHLKLFFGYSDIKGAIRIATDFFLYFPTKWGAFLEPHNPQKSQGSYCRLFS